MVTDKAQSARRKRTSAALAAAGCVTALLLGPTAPQSRADTPLPPRHYLLVGGFASPGISSVSVTRDGALTTVPGSPFAAGLGSLGMAITPDAQKVYSVDSGSGAIIGYRIGSDGTLTPIDGGIVLVGLPVVGAAVTPDGSRLFVTLGGGTTSLGSVRSYAISPSGTLSRTGAPDAPIDSPISQIAIAPDASHLIVTNYLANSVTSFAIAPDATLAQVGTPAPAGNKPVIPAFTPDGKYLYVSNEGSGDLSAYAVGRDGSLTAVPGSPYPSGGTTHGAVSTPDSHRLYVPNTTANTVTGWSISTGGRLTPLPGSPYQMPVMPGRVTLSADGKHLFVIQAIAVNNPTLHSQVYSYLLQPDGQPVPSGLPPADTGLVWHDGSNAFLTPNQGPLAALAETGSTFGATRGFSAAASSDPDGTVAQYAWDFGDGQRLLTTTPDVSHTYAKPGTWTVTVTVTDDEGCSTSLIYEGTSVACGGGPRARARTTITT
ncbi:PKD domain-containing protein [Amycolatopsis sp. FU40]|uniref:PKD domain-containing protein n=1 Tax=Amycolatopsis sp. FU40 TaxID=2914159 RepID=UPI001F19F42F|nr:PKD domain-containing protein [Amycolatopsis sp. FU40]UKD57563.1 PKD domain-containing protein [Amycolatopsis sp. FU40]